MSKERVQTVALSWKKAKSSALPAEKALLTKMKYFKSGVNPMRRFYNGDDDEDDEGFGWDSDDE